MSIINEDLARYLVNLKIQNNQHVTKTMREWMTQSNTVKFRIGIHSANQIQDLFPSLIRLPVVNDKFIYFQLSDLTEAELNQPVWEGNYYFYAAPAYRDAGGLNQSLFTSIYDSTLDLN